MKKIVSILMCIIVIACVMSYPASAAVVTVPVTTQNALDYYQIEAGNQYVVYGRFSSAFNSSATYISMLIAGNVSNTYKKAVYSSVGYSNSSYTLYHTFTGINSVTGSKITALSKSRGLGTSIENNASYVGKIATYSATTRPNILVNATLEAYRTSTDRVISYPNITTVC